MALTCIFLFPHIDPDESCMELERRRHNSLDVFSAAVQTGLKLFTNEKARFDRWFE